MGAVAAAGLLQGEQAPKVWYESVTSPETAERLVQLQKEMAKEAQARAQERKQQLGKQQ